MEICSLCAKKHNDGSQHACASKDLIACDNNQIVVASPDGTLYRVTIAVTNAGAASLTTEAV